MNYGKLSIVVTIYNDEKTLNRCLDSLINQSYQDLEVILVNDCSKDNSDKIINEYCSKDKRFSKINNTERMGDAKSKLSGSKIASGKYIAFLNADDYVSVDFYRNLIFNLENNDSDIAIGNVVLEYDSNNQKCFSINDMNFDLLTGKEIIDCYFKQEGLNFLWHTLWNKVYRIELWRDALSYYEKVEELPTIFEDIYLSTVLLYYAKKLTKINNDAYFYCKNDYGKLLKNKNNKIEENNTFITKTFELVLEFLKSKKIDVQYKKEIDEWSSCYKKDYKDLNNIFDIELSYRKNRIKEKEIIFELINYYKENNKKQHINLIYQSNWDNRFEEIKKAICDSSIKCVSFDIFDTLITRPFLEAKDLFSLLDDEFQTLINNKGIEFSKLRIAASIDARKEKIEVEEISLDDIYDVLNKNYGIEKSILSKMKKMEIEYEKRFCAQRKSGFELYELAKFLKKKVIFTSDMYLPLDVIKDILKENNYKDFDEIFLSNDIGKTKYNKTLYAYVIEKINLEPGNIIHIGDNFDTDYLKAKEMGLKAFYFKRTIDVLLDKSDTNNLAQIFIKDLPDWVDNLSSKFNYLGLRCMIAVVANKYFDNPYRPFNKKTDFNLDPNLIGYYALGMHLFGVTKWLLDNCENKHYDSIIFMARDGYLPMKSFNIMKRLYKDVPEEKYFYSSRKASIPFIISEKLDFYKLSNFVYRKTPNEIIEILDDIIDIDYKKLNKLCEEKKIKLDEKLDIENNFYSFLSIIANNFFDSNKQKEKIKVLKKYFEEIFNGKTCAFDVGYSARIEFYLSNLINKPIDTYFININAEEAMKYSKMANFQLETFYDYKPKITGLMREFLFSMCAPSCTGYKINLKTEEVEPVFENYTIDYLSKNIIETIQKEALQFVEDMISIFDKDIFKLNYQRTYISMPYESFIQSVNGLDRKIFDSINFEDKVAPDSQVTIGDEWEKELKKKNQHELEKLLNLQDYLNKEFVDLYGKNTLERMIYYAMFDREAFKDRMKKRISK